MKPVLLATVAMVLYAIQNVVIEQRLSRVSVTAILVICYAIMLPLALARYSMIRMAGDAVAFPTGAVLVFTLVAGVTYFLADYSYIAAYTNGGTLMSVTTVAIMLPIFASIVKFAWARELPNGYQIAGYALAIIAIVLVGKGNR
ncbi:MAG: EamA family transporter [bacterium]|nr:EamA family transporter [bacterium]